MPRSRRSSTSRRRACATRSAGSRARPRNRRGNPVSGAFESAFSAAALRRGAPWLRGTGPDSDVVVSSRVRLARNLAGLPFVRKAGREQRDRILSLVRERAMSAGVARCAATGGGGQTERMLWLDIHRCPALERTLLVERHLISKEHAKQGGGGATAATPGQPAPKEAAEAATEAAAASASAGGEPRAVAITLPDEQLSIMVNEEDHLRIQVLRSGMDLDSALDLTDSVDDALEGAGEPAHGADGPGLEYAYSARFGYLTACPTNVGTGLRVSVMLHLPALKLTGEMEKVKRATRDLSLAVRGYYGEGSDAAGDFYQISNQTTLGRTERAILDQFEHQIIPQVIQYERHARRVLVERRRRVIEDQVLRALGVLRHARLLTPEEALTLLSQVRLGIYTGLISNVPAQTVSQLMLLTQPAHLQRLLDREMDQNERREARADLVRQHLAGE
ncbi:MAG: protein arginine kinase [Phycisphaeraceae bacterium]|nr:protein arginine kinase [Phycisphaeraceae bacterium]